MKASLLKRGAFQFRFDGAVKHGNNTFHAHLTQFDDAQIKETPNVVVSKLGLSHPKGTIDTDLNNNMNVRPE